MIDQENNLLAEYSKETHYSWTLARLIEDHRPAAQAVLDAVVVVSWDWSNLEPASSSVVAAAALRAVADQVVPVNGSRKNNEIRAELLGIATELESQ